MVNRTRLPMPIPIRYSSKVNAPRTRPGGGLVEEVVLNAIAGNVGADLPVALNVLRRPGEADGDFTQVVVITAIQFKGSHRGDGNGAGVSQTLAERAHIGVGSETLGKIGSREIGGNEPVGVDLVPGAEADHLHLFHHDLRGPQVLALEADA